MKKFLILIIFILFFSISTVCADGNFTSLQTEIEQSTDVIEISQDYTYDNNADKNISDGITVFKNDFVINGNGHKIDGNNASRIFQVIGRNITLNNLILTNSFSENGGAISTLADLTLNNVTFISNRATENGGCIFSSKTVTVSDCIFDNNYAKTGAAITTSKDANVINSEFKNSHAKWSLIYSNGAVVINSTFINSTSEYATAIYSEGNVLVNNTKFINLHANKTAGAIGLKNYKIFIIDNSLFFNTSAVKNGGAIYLDSEENDIEKVVALINNTKFINASGDFGGAITHLTGSLAIQNTLFWNNIAKYAGGAIYSGISAIGIFNATFIDNKIIENNTKTATIHLDLSGISITHSILVNNTNGIFIKEASLDLEDSYLENNGYGVYGLYNKDVEFNNTTFKNSNNSLNNTENIKPIYNKGTEVNLTNNTINIKNLPKYFNLNDWKWVSSVKDQGNMGSCWTFGILGTLESALLKATGIEYTFSENNMQNLMIRYSPVGSLVTDEGGFGTTGISYLLSWLGAISEEYDSYDELGKLSPIIPDVEKYHVQDVVIIPPRKNTTDNNLIKKAILDYGSLIIGYSAQNSEPYYNETNGAQYYNETKNANHLVSLVGWDDNYSKNNFIITPPGDGAWIIKNSYGTSHGINGYNYVSYYDSSFCLEQPEYAFIINNTKNYMTIYQTDFGGSLYLNTTNKTISYKNQYNNVSTGLISAVGTFFKENSQDYSFKIYVNDNLKLTQNGTSSFAGYHTIELEKEIPINECDNFTIIMTTSSLPLINESRVKFKPNTTYVQYDKEWEDLSLMNATVSLKAYTKELIIYTEDLVKIYKNESRFEALITEANKTVTFEINGKEYHRTSDENGVAKIAINLVPGNYTIKTIFNGTSVDNNITVLPTLIADNLVKYFRNNSQFYVSLTDDNGNPISNITITMNINGVFYNRTTNENGIARLNINLIPGEYILTATDPLTGLKMSYTITVLPVLTGKDMVMTYKDGSKFEATLVDSQGKALSCVNVTFNINGVFYNRTTDENGIAKLNINLMAGEYIITSQYAQAVTSNKVTVIAK